MDVDILAAMTKLLVEVDDDMLETVRVMLGVSTKKDTVNGALALLIAGQDERVRLGIEPLRLITMNSHLTTDPRLGEPPARHQRHYAGEPR